MLQYKSMYLFPAGLWPADVRYYVTSINNMNIYINIAHSAC